MTQRGRHVGLADQTTLMEGLAGTTFEFRGELSEEQQASLQEDIAGVVTFFAERYGDRAAGLLGAL